MRLAPGEVLLDVTLHAPDPALRGEGNGYTSVPFGVPIPLGWQDGLCPDVTMKNMVATIHLLPDLDAVSGEVHLKDPTVELNGDLALSVGDAFIQDQKTKLKKQFEKQYKHSLGKTRLGRQSRRH